MLQKSWHLGLGLLLVLFPSIILMHKSAPGIFLHLFAGIGLIKLIIYSTSMESRYTIKTFWYKYKYICIAMPSILIVNVIIHTLSGNITDAFSNPAQRLALTGFVLFGLYNTPKQLHKYLNIGFIIACFIATIITFNASSDGQIRPIVDTQNLLNYANYIVLLGIFSLINIENNNTTYKRTETTIIIMAFIAVIYSIILSQSKGPFLSLLILFFVYLHSIKTR